MRYKASLTSGVVLVLVMQLALRSAVPVLAVPAPPAVAASPPALGLPDLAITALDEPSLDFALPAYFGVTVPDAGSRPALTSIEPGPLPKPSEGPAAVRTLQEVSGEEEVRRLHQYFVPFDDRDLWQLFEGKATCHRPRARACGPLVSKIFVTAGADGTVYYYDHWEDEDGYDEDPRAPGPTTERGVLDAGATVVFASDILTESLGVPVQGQYYYDGRDRITIVGEDANVVRLANASGFAENGNCNTTPAESDTWLAAAWEVLEVEDWGTSYHATVGEDLDYRNGDPDDHDYTGLEVMAWKDGTTITYTTMNRVEVVVRDAGETYFVPGANGGPGGTGAQSTDDVVASDFVQVQMLTGACSYEIVSGHGYTLQPEDVWDREYWAPVPGFMQRPPGRDGRRHVDTDIYLHNPDTVNAISVTITSGVSETILSIPAKGTVSVLNETPWTDLATSGTHMSSSAAFWGVAVIDSATSGTGDSDDWDWGYSLIPASKLSSQLVVGYAPGSPDLADNGNVAFVVAVTDTVIYVDLEHDGLPDPFDMDGDGQLGSADAWGVPEWDECVSALGIPVRAGDVLRVGDPFDRNLEGARIYTAGLGEHIAAAWGEDPMWADDVNYLDLGYTLLPLGVPRFTKVHDLADDADRSGGVSPGDTLTYTLLVHNNGMSTMNDVVLLDDLPYTWTQFVVGSLQVTPPPPADTIEYDDGTGWRTTPRGDARRLRITWPYLEPQQAVTVTFRGRVSATIPVAVTGFCNYGTVSSASTHSVTDKTCPPVQRPLLAIAKAVTPTLVSPGDRITYTVIVYNSGDGVALPTVITDTLPPWIDYVPGTLDLTWPVVQVETVTEVLTHATFFRGFYADDFDRSVTETTFYGGDDSSEPLRWTTDWGEVNDDGDPGSGQVQVRTDGNALSVPAYVWMGAPVGFDAGLTRTLDLSLFVSPTLRYYPSRAPSVAGDDIYYVTVDGNRIFADTYQWEDYCFQERDELWPFAGQPGVTLGFMTSTGMEAGDYYRFDHISVHEKAPERTVQRERESQRTTVVYRTVMGIDPAGYDPVARTMAITEVLRLPPGEVLTATFQALVDVNVDVPVVGSMWLTNTSCVGATNWPDSPACDDAPVRLQQAADLEIVKSDQPAEYVMPGEILTYTLEYGNVGGEEVREVYITDTLPNEVTYRGVVEQPPGWSDPLSYDPGLPATLTWYTPTLAAGATGTIVYTVTVNPGSLGTITNTVCISTATPETDYGNNCDDEQTVVTIEPDVTVSKAVGPDPAAPRSRLVYTLVYANLGPVLAEDVVVSDTLPAEVTYASANPPPDSGPPNPLLWNLGRLDAGVTGTITVAVTVRPGVTETITNTVCISTTTSETDPDNNCAQVDTEPADVTISKSDDPDPVGRDGPDLVYTLVYTNNGPAVAEGVVVTDVLPPEVTFVQAAPAQASGPNPLIWNLGALAAGQSGTIVVTVTVPCVGPILINTVHISTVTPESNYGNNDDEESADVLVADVTIDKLDEPDPGTPGKTVIYTLQYANKGPYEAKEVYIRDTLPVSVTFGGMIEQPPGWSKLPSSSPPLTLTWYTPMLAAGVSGRIVYTVTADPKVPEEIKSRVCISTTTPETDCENCDVEPTPVRLLYFRATPLPGAVLLEWATAWEVDTYGFALLRGVTDRLEDAREIAFVPAAGHGGGGGASYRHRDRGLEIGPTYSYWLAEVDTSGRRTVYHPATAAALPGMLYRRYLPLVWRPF